MYYDSFSSPESGLPQGLFAPFFAAGHPISYPKGQIIYALGCGLLTAVIRLWGGYPEGVSFAILLMNAFSLFIDMRYEKIRHRERRALYAEQQTETV